jgi:hypothetical protein
MPKARPGIGTRFLARKRPLALTMIRGLHEGLGNPAQSLIKAGRGEAA